ncbi:MAG: hypothetical protein K0S16_1768, partial [Moraxellaceae bacterium]|nr:hypothetical protein [Moraxellaceae bacterium]
RLAVVLHHSRSREPLPDIRLECGEMKYELRFPEGWLARHPLTREDLATEAESFAALGMRLVTSEY